MFKEFYCPKLFLFLAFIVMTFIGVQVVYAQEESEGVSPSEMEVQVKTVRLERGTMPMSIKAMGTLVPRQQAPVSITARFPGMVSSIEVQDGEKVEAGQLLIKLDDRIAQTNLLKAQAGLRIAEAELQNAQNGGLDMTLAELELAAKQASVDAEQARLESQRENTLLNDRLTSVKSAQDLRLAMEDADRKARMGKEKVKLFKQSGRDADIKRLQGTVDQAKAELGAAQLEVESTIIRASFSGQVAGLNVNIGSSIDDRTVIAQIAGDRNTAFRLWIAPQDADAIRIGLSARIHSLSAKEPLSATVTSVGGELDAETGLVPVEVQCDPVPTAHFRIGETVFSEIITQLLAEGFVVPVSALTVADDKASVFCVDRTQIAHAVPVTVLVRDADRAAIQGESLVEGGILIVDGNFNLPDGAHVVEESAQ